MVFLRLAVLLSCCGLSRCAFLPGFALFDDSSSDTFSNDSSEAGSSNRAPPAPQAFSPPPPPPVPSAFNPEIDQAVITLDAAVRPLLGAKEPLANNQRYPSMSESYAHGMLGPNKQGRQKTNPTSQLDSNGRQDMVEVSHQRPYDSYYSPTLGLDFIQQVGPEYLNWTVRPANKKGATRKQFPPGSISSATSNPLVIANQRLKPGSMPGIPDKALRSFWGKKIVDMPFNVFYYISPAYMYMIIVGAVYSEHSLATDPATENVLQDMSLVFPRENLPETPEGDRNREFEPNVPKDEPKAIRRPPKELFNAINNPQVNAYGASSDLGFWREALLLGDSYDDNWMLIESWLKQRKLRQDDVEAIIQFMQSSRAAHSRALLTVVGAFEPLASRYFPPPPGKQFFFLQSSQIIREAMDHYDEVVFALKEAKPRLPSGSRRSKARWQGKLLTTDMKEEWHDAHPTLPDPPKV